MPNEDPFADLAEPITPTTSKRPRTDDLIQKHATRTGLDAEFVRRVVGQESRGNPNAQSWAGAQGLGQLMPGTAKRYGVKNPRDPDENLRGATDYLRDLTNEFKEPEKVLAAYNAGEGRVRKMGYERTRRLSNLPKGDPRRGGYQGSTGEYVDKILKGYKQNPQKADPFADLADQSSDPFADIAEPQGTKVRPNLDESLSRGGVLAQPPATSLAGTTVRPMRRKITDPIAQGATVGVAPGGAAGMAHYDALREAENQALIPTKRQPLANASQILTEATHSPEAKERSRIREEVVGERKRQRENVSTKYGPSVGSPIGVLATGKMAESATHPVQTIRNLLTPEDQQVQEEVERRRGAELRASTPEMLNIRKEYGAMSAPARTVAQPIARTAAGILKVGGGIASLAGLAPNQLSDWANARGRIIEEGSTLAPLTPQGEEVVKGVPEKVGQAVADLGLTIAQLAALQKASGLPMGRLMAAETALKTSDMPKGERAAAVAQSFAMGKALEGHLGRVSSAAVFDAPTATESGVAVLEGKMSPMDALIQTGVGAGVGLALGGKRTKEPETQRPSQQPAKTEIVPPAETATHPATQPLTEGATATTPSLPGERRRGSRMATPEEVALGEEMVRQHGQRRQAQRRGDVAEDQAHTDTLTGLPNKRAWGKAEARLDPEKESVVMMDIRNAKAFNKEGEKAGDPHFQEAFNALKQSAVDLGISDRQVFRIGGDDGAVIVPKGQEAALIKRAQEIYPDRDFDGTRVGLSLGSGPDYNTANAAAKAHKATQGESLRPDKPTAEVGRPLYWGGKEFQVDRNNPLGTFLSPDKTYAEKFASQSEGSVHEFSLKPDAKIAPEPIGWQEYEAIWGGAAKHYRGLGFDAVRVIEPNGQGESLAVVNSDAIVKGSQSAGKEVIPEASEIPLKGEPVESTQVTSANVSKPAEVAATASATIKAATPELQKFADQSNELRQRSTAPELSAMERSAMERKAERLAQAASGVELRRSGADPYELIDDIIIKGGELYRKAKPAFDEWAKSLKGEFGPESEPHLKNVYAHLTGEKEGDLTLPSSTAAKREKVTADRAARGEDSIAKPERKPDQVLLDDAKAANEADRSEPMRLADQVLNGKKGALSDKETVQLDLHVQGLKNKYDTVNKELAEAKTPEQVAELGERSEAMLREMRVAEEAWAASGTEKGRALRAQRIEIDNDMRLLTLVSGRTKAEGKPLTTEQHAQVKEWADKYAELETKYQESNDRAVKAEAAKAAERIKEDVARENRRGGRVQRKGNLDEQAAQIRQQIAQAWAKQKSSGSEIHSAMGLAKLDPEGVVTKLVVELAKNRIQAHVGLKAEALVDEVHNLLKDSVNLSRREVAEMISGYGKTFQMSQEAADVRMRELKSIIASNLGKADIIEKGIRPLRRGLQRDKPSQEVREAMRELRDTLKEHGMRVEKGKGSPEEQQKSSLDAAKTQTRNRIEDLSKWIADGKRTVGTKSEVIPDAELRGLRAERDRLQEVFDAIDDPAADQRKLENALRVANKSVAELEQKIQSGNIASQPRGAQLTSPELTAARIQQKALRGIINDLRKAAKTPADPIETEARKLLAANKSLNTRMEKQIAEFERRMKQGDFSTPPKREPKVYNSENLRLQKQLEQIKQDYNRANYKATRSRFGQVTDELAKAANVPKTLKSMGDISAVFRQGGFYSITHPIQGLAKPTAAMLRSFSETGFENVKEAIKNHSKFDQAKRDGVEFTGIDKNDPNLSHQEEGFFGGETVDVLASGKANPLRALKAVKNFSQRTFVSFLDSQRMNMYDLMTEGLKAQGLTPRNAPDSYKGAAKLINIGTGRGNLGKTGNQAAPLLNIAMFSPRLVASRVQLLNNMFNPVTMARKPKGVRAQNIKDNVKFLAATATFMGLATALGGEVNRDPDDADFLKIRFGKTTYDTLTGLQQPLRYIVNMGRAATGGDTHPGQDALELTKRFARSKASPLAGLAVDAISGEDFQGRQFSKARAAKDIVMPLPIKDFSEAMEKEGLLKGFVKALPASTGIGVQTYDQRPDKPKTHAEKLARKLFVDKLPDRSRTDEQIDADKKKSDLRSRSRKGEDVNKEVVELLKAGTLSKGQAQNIIKARNQSRFIEDLKHLGADEALTVYRVMSADEKKVALPLILSKMRNSEAPAPEKQKFIQKARTLGVIQ